MSVFDRIRPPDGFTVDHQMMPPTDGVRVTLTYTADIEAEMTLEYLVREGEAGIIRVLDDMKASLINTITLRMQEEAE